MAEAGRMSKFRNKTQQVIQLDLFNGAEPERSRKPSQADLIREMYRTNYELGTFPEANNAINKLIKKRL